MVINSQINQITRDVIVTHRNKRYLAKQRGVNYGRATTARCQMRSLTLFSGQNYGVISTDCSRTRVTKALAFES